MPRPVVLPAAFTNPDAAVLAAEAEKFAQESGLPQVQASWQYLMDALGQRFPTQITRAKASIARINRLR